MCYEGNFGVETFNGPFKLDEVYALLNKCFETMDGVDFELNCKILLVKFKVVVLGVFNLAFELRLKELVIAEDGRLSIELEQHRQIVDELRGKMDNIIAGLREELAAEKKARLDLEQTCNNNMESVYKWLDVLGNAEIEMAMGSIEVSLGARPIQKYFPINTKTMMLDGSRYDSMSTAILRKIKHFYNLETLMLRECGCGKNDIGERTSLDILSNLHGSFTKLILVGSNQNFGDMLFIKNLPNLKELTMIQCIVYATSVSTLRTIKHNLKKITIQGTNVNETPTINKTEMEAYCKENGIELVIQ